MKIFATDKIIPGVSMEQVQQHLKEESKIASEIELEFGKLDLLVNNAGINSKDDPDKSVFMKSFRLSDLDPDEIIRHKFGCSESRLGENRYGWCKCFSNNRAIGKRLDRQCFK